MSAIDDLIAQIPDTHAKLREHIQREANDLKKKLKGEKKFGLVFERHLPERTLLQGAPVRVGSKIVSLMDDASIVAKKAIWRVVKIEGEKAICVPEMAAEGRKTARKEKEIPLPPPLLPTRHALLR